MSKRKIKCARCLNERPIYDHANHHCEACFLIANNANLSAMELTMLASLERLKEERGRIAAAVAVLREEYDLASHISKYPNGFNGGRPTTESEDDLSDVLLKALAILDTTGPGTGTASLLL